MPGQAQCLWPQVLRPMAMRSESLDAGAVLLVFLCTWLHIGRIRLCRLGKACRLKSGTSHTPHSVDNGLTDYQGLD